MMSTLTCLTLLRLQQNLSPQMLFFEPPPEPKGRRIDAEKTEDIQKTELRWKWL